jgi:hypothetical protein|tara:strand:+ start:83 stop:427 length:345 start_codon:yes stop_codon:yes gene_type:complete
MKIWDKNICLTLKLSIKIILLAFFSILLLAFIYPQSPPKELIIELGEEPWEPSEEDIAYQDSMYSIIEQTQLDIEEIKLDINGIIYKLDRLYYEDGSWDSIRYVDGGVIDNRIN